MKKQIIAIATIALTLSLWTIASAAEKVYYFHNDHLGTPQAITDESGVKVWEADYLPFGNATVNEDPDGDSEVVVANIRFPGQYFDEETGLHYNYYRDYDPATGRYVEADPIGIEQGMNHLFVYVQNNPVNFVDPTGLEKTCVPPSSLSSIGRSNTWGHKWDGIPQANILHFELPCPEQDCHKASAVECKVKQVDEHKKYTSRDTFLREVFKVTPCGIAGIVRYEVESRAVWSVKQDILSLVEVCYECVRCK